MSEAPRDPVERAMMRLAAVFNPPEVANPEQFRLEFIAALKDFPSDALIDGVSEIIKTRRAKSFPSIGEVRTACVEAMPRQASQQAQRYHDVEQATEEKRAFFVSRLREHPHLDWMLKGGVHVRALEFAMENNRLPNVGDWHDMEADIQKVQNHLNEAAGPNPHPIIAKMAEAVQYRRRKLAEELKPELKEAAE